MFDYKVTVDSPASLTVDGGLDGIAHAWEVFMGASGPSYEKIKEVAQLCMRLVVFGLQKIKKDKRDIEGRTALGLGTDLGGYAIMLGGTSGPHLGSFSLIDVLSHGRACALLNPYYTVLFAPVIQDQLKMAGSIFKEAGYIQGEDRGVERKRAGVGRCKGNDCLLEGYEFPDDLEGVRGHAGAYPEDAGGREKPSIEEQTPEHAHAHGRREGRCRPSDETGSGSLVYR